MNASAKLLDRSPFRFEDISFEKLIQMLVHIPENATLRIGNVMMPENEYLMKINGEWCRCIANTKLEDCRIEQWSWQRCVMDIETAIFQDNSHKYPDSLPLAKFEEYKKFNSGWFIDFDFYYKYPISGVIKTLDEKSESDKPRIHLTSEPMRFTSETDVDKVYAYA